MKRIVILVLLCSFIFYKYFLPKDVNPIPYSGVDVVELSPPSLQVYYRTLEYSEKYNVPTYISFGMARKETTYRGPLQYSYTPVQISSGNALGTYQILLSTARWFTKDYSISKQDLLHNIKLNTEIGVSYVREQYDTYGSWSKATGYYNTGYPIVNGYAKEITTNKFSN